MRARRAFVVGAFIPNGGTFMAYHLGRILQLDFGFQAIAVTVAAESAANGIFRYDPKFPSLPISEMESIISAEDVLICNPSFSSYMFGLRLPGTKICYAQGFNTFSLLDCRFHSYVAVSQIVAAYLSAVYRLAPRVIPPFLTFEEFPVAPSWKDRPERSVVFHPKGDPAIVTPMLQKLVAILSERAPEIEVGRTLPAGMPHVEFLRHLGKSRYLLTLSPAEGFGLIPLEAMALGTVVCGFDGFGGRDFMQPAINCSTARYPHIEDVAQRLIDVVRSARYGAELSEAGKETACKYTYEKFRASWREVFETALKT